MGICGSQATQKPILVTEEPADDPTRDLGSIRESFILVRTIGSGSFGSVFLVKDKRSGLERAAKEIIKANISEDLLPAMYNELNILKECVNHS
jgi:serine/threonine protein kinase